MGRLRVARLLAARAHAHRGTRALVLPGTHPVLPRLEAFGLYHDDIAAFHRPARALDDAAGAGGTGWPRLAGVARPDSGTPAELRHRLVPRRPWAGIHRSAAGICPRTPQLPSLVRHPACMRLGVGAPAGKRRSAQNAGHLRWRPSALLYLPFVTALRAHQFGDEIRRTQVEAQHHRGSARAQYDAGRALAGHAEAMRIDAPAYSFARAHFERAGELDPGFKPGWLGLIYLNCKPDSRLERAWIDGIGPPLAQTPFGPADSERAVQPEGDVHRRHACAWRDRMSNGSLLRRWPTRPVALHVRADLHSWLADYLVLRERDLAAAQVELGRALEIAPYNSGNRLKRAQLAISCWAGRGSPWDAGSAWRKCLESCRKGDTGAN